MFYKPHAVIDCLFFVGVFVVWTHTAIGSVISWERFEHDLCLPGWFSGNIIRGPTHSENDRYLCMWDERIRHDSCQKLLGKRPHSVTKSEECRVLVPSFHSLRMERLGPWNVWRPRTACILWLGLSYGSSSNESGSVWDERQPLVMIIYKYFDLT